jgi:tRNA(Ile)-lysidine synthase
MQLHERLHFIFIRMSLQKAFCLYWNTNFPTINLSTASFLVAVSGGVDSIVLLDVMIQLKARITIVHCNFQLREEESERDELFVRDLAKKYCVDIYVKKFNTISYASENKISIQEAARNLRYNWFAELLHIAFETTTSFLLTAHNANDNAETFLMNAARGTGLQGLLGIPLFDKERKIIRPLLFTDRNEIIQYAITNQLNWVEDSSNEKDNYTRNFFRHQIIPKLQSQYKSATANINHTIRHLNGVHLILEEAIQKIKKKILVKKGSEIYIPILLLKKQSAVATVIWEIFKNYQFTAAQVPELIKLLDAANSSYILSSSHIVFVNRNWLVITAKKTEDSECFLIDNNTPTISFLNGRLLLQSLEVIPTVQVSNNIALLNVAEITFPLLLRKWKQGDYFYPFGMTKKKKLSKFFIDNKFSLTDKENTWVLEDATHKIVWVVNHRIDNRFKLKSTTQKTLQITYLK